MGSMRAATWKQKLEQIWEGRWKKQQQTNMGCQYELNVDVANTEAEGDNDFDIFDPVWK